MRTYFYLVIAVMALSAAGCETNEPAILDVGSGDDASSADADLGTDTGPGAAAAASDAGSTDADSGADIGPGADAAAAASDAGSTDADLGTKTGPGADAASAASDGGSRADAGDAVDAELGWDASSPEVPDAGIGRPAMLGTPAPKLVFAPTALGRFAAEQSFTITNSGDETSSAISLFFALGGVGATDFVLQPFAAGDCVSGVTSLAAGTSCTVRLTFQPSATGGRSASLVFIASSGGTGSVALSGTGITPAALQTASTGLAFGTTLIGQTSVGQSFTLTNSGEETSSAIAIAIDGTDSDAFRLQPFVAGDCVSGSTTLAHGAACTVRLVFSSRASGARSAAVTFAATIGGVGSVPVAGTSITPASLGTGSTGLAFDTTLVGSTSADQSFTITNAGEQTSSAITLSLEGTNPGDFALVSLSSSDCVSGTTLLATGQSCIVHVVFAPTASGARRAAVSFAATTGGSANVPLEGTSLTPASLATASTGLSFGDTVLGQTSAEKSFTIANSGGATSSPITVSITGTHRTDFALQPFGSGDCLSGTTTLANGQSCAVRVVFSPTASGARSALVSFTAAAGGSGTVPLAGNGKKPAALAASTIQLTFANTGVGHTSAEQSFTLRNSGDLASSVITTAISGPDSGDFALQPFATGDCVSGTTTLAAGASCSVRVIFRPTVLAGRPASFTFSASSGGSGTVALVGVGVTPAALTTTSTGLTFAKRGVHSSAELSFAVKNNGGEVSSAVNVWLSGANAGEFVLPASSSGDCLSRTVVGGGTCTVRVKFKPTVSRARAATVSFSASIGGSGSVPLGGTGDGQWTPAGSVPIPARRWPTATLLQNGKALIVGGYDSGDLSSAVLYDPATNLWSSTGSLAHGRYGHTATLLANGKVLVAGGMNTAAKQSAELYDPVTGTWSATGSLNTGRGSHAAALLSNGKVLVAGGYSTSTAEVYDPVTGVWSAAGSMSYSPYDLTATLLPNGKVLVAGGYSTGYQTHVEIYDPVASTWSVANSMATARQNATATLLPNGKALLAGGITVYGVPTSSAELFDPATGNWANTSSMAATRGNHTAALLKDGRVLVAGGDGNNNSTLSSAEIYDPATGNWSGTQSLAAARTEHAATILANGKVLVAGGSTSPAEVYDPGAGEQGTWSSTVFMGTGRSRHTATLLGNGKVLIAGGDDATATHSLASSELYTPLSGTWSATGSLVVSRSRHTATLLGNGKVLVAAGKNGGITEASAELYTPSSGTWAATGSLSTYRYDHSATTLQNGTVLVAGGYSTRAEPIAEIYDPVAGTWASGGALAKGRYYHSATLLGDGRVLVAGGYNAGYLATAELYNPATHSWSSTGSMVTSRMSHTATLLADGKVFVYGGVNESAVAAAEIFDPATGKWSPAASSTPRSSHTAVLLGSGKVFVASGLNTWGDPDSSAVLYDPGSDTWSSTGSLAVGRSHHTMTVLPSGDILVTGGYINLSMSAEVYHP